MSQLKFKIDGKPSDLVRGNPTFEKVTKFLNGVADGDLLSTRALLAKTKTGATSFQRIASRVVNYRVSVAGGAFYWGNLFTVGAAKRRLNEA